MGKIVTASLREDLLVLSVIGRITSGNAGQLQAEIGELRAAQPHGGLVFDLSCVEYISSAGLRVLLSVYNEEKKTASRPDFFRLEGVQAAVYETLEITGFAELFPVQRALRSISLQNAVPIGGGFFSTVYRLDNEDIIKVYNENAGDGDVQRELQMAKYALLLGIPTAISYDIVEAEGRRGVIFEQMNAGSLRDAVRDNPERIGEYIEQYTELLKQLHAAEDGEHRLTDVREPVRRAPELLAEYFTPAERERLQALLDSIPPCDGIIHGDCHVKNIMLHNGELLLIDLDTLSRGYPVVELGNIYYTYTCFEELWPGNTEEFIGITAAQGKALRDGVLEGYFRGVSPEDFAADLDRVRLIGWLRMLTFLHGFRKEDAAAAEHVVNRLREAMARVDTLELVLPARP